MDRTLQQESAMKLQRILNMKPAELAFRCREHMFKTIERLTVHENGGAPMCLLENPQADKSLAEIITMFASNDANTACVLLQNRFVKLAPPRFFAGANDSVVINELLCKSNVLCQEIIEQADSVCNGQFDILGYGKISFGSPVNWHSEPLAGLDIPVLHWSRIDPLLQAQVGDSKVVWELNRHQWLLDLGQAYLITGNDRYAQACVIMINDWMDANPPGYGINWNSSLEVALRLIAWCWCLMLLKGAAAVTPEFFVNMLSWMQAHARHIERYLSHYYSPNTHLTGEALGLFYLGTLMPELEGATRWKQLGKQILQEQLARQVSADGVYFEQSTSYQYYTVEIYLQFMILAERNSIDVPLWMNEKLAKMLDFLLAVRKPDNLMPMIGDADGGWLLPLVRRLPGDHGGLFSTAAVLLNKGCFSWAAGFLAPETLWLLGSSVIERWNLLQPESPRNLHLNCFSDGGYVVLRNGWDRRSHQLIFDTGPLGCHFSSGHGHADLLSIQCSAFGESYIVDPGTFCYTTDSRWRNYFRSSHAHSTVVIDNHSQAEPKGPFSWYDKPTAKLIFCTEKPGYSVVGAEHHAYHDLADPVTHRRRLVFVDARYWVVIDDLDGKAEHRVDLHYQFAALPVIKESNNWVRALGKKSALLLKTFSAIPLQTTITSGQSETPCGWLSLNYGQRIPAPSLNFAARERLPLRIVTLIYPVGNPHAAPPDVRYKSENNTVTNLTIGAGNKEWLRIGPDSLSIMRSISEWNF